METMPEKIGRYEIKSQLGKGGMAVVYLGHDPFSDRDVAVKVIPSELSSKDPQFHARFKEEIRISAKLDHSSIVPVFDVGEENGQPYLVMRHMRGGTLADKIEAGPLGIEEAIRIIGYIAPALDDAHAKRVVHRDIKPSNILFDSHDIPSISDFGIAKVLETQSSGFNRSGAIGTPAYMAPEQVQEHPVDGRADIYSLGIVFYEMLTGKRPHDAFTRIVQTETTPFPRILEVNKDLPSWVEAIIYKSMALDRNERFSTAGEMLSAIKDNIHNDVMARVRDIPKPRSSTPAIIVATFVVLGLAVGAFFLRDIFTPPPTAMPSPSIVVTIPTRASATKEPTNTPASTKAATATPTEEQITPIPSLPILGGADKIAFIKDNNIWMMNVDGSDLRSLTDDKTEKFNLEWTPDGKSVIYITGKTLKMVNIETKKDEIITSFGSSEYFEAFRISPDGKQVAISLARKLHVVPFNLGKLRSATTRDDLLAMNGCIYYGGAEVEEVLWSDDGKRVAIKFAAASIKNLADYIRVLDISLCGDSTPLRLAQFPDGHFAFNNTIISFNWDGNNLFFLNNDERNDGFGDLGMYNSETYLFKWIAPIDNVCCYRDATFSPDGTYVMFAFQDVRLGEKNTIDLYYVPVGLLEANANFDPLPLTPDFFNKRNASPMPALRRVQK